MHLSMPRWWKLQVNKTFLVNCLPSLHLSGREHAGLTAADTWGCVAKIPVTAHVTRCLGEPTLPAPALRCNAINHFSAVCSWTRRTTYLGSQPYVNRNTCCGKYTLPYSIPTHTRTHFPDIESAPSTLELPIFVRITFWLSTEKALHILLCQITRVPTVMWLKKRC